MNKKLKPIKKSSYPIKKKKKKQSPKKRKFLKKKSDLKKKINKRPFMKKKKAKPKKANPKNKIISRIIKLKPLRFNIPPPNLDTILIEPAPDHMESALKLGRILHTPTNPAGQMSTQATSLRKLGVPVSFCSYRKQGRFSYPEGLPSPIEKLSKSLHEYAKIDFAIKSSKIYKILHFHGGETFTKYKYTDLPYLSQAKNKIVMSFWGSEVRKTSIANLMNPYARVKLTDENEIHRRLNVLSQYVDAVIVPDHELYEYVRGYFKKVFLVRAVVDHRKFSPLYPDVNNQRPLVVHAPSNRFIKGTDHIARVVQSLKQKVDFDYVQVENTTNANVLKWIQKADLLIDQLHLGIYGTVAIEAMLFGKPVISHIREDLLTKYPANMPVVPANPQTFEKVLHNLITNPELRHELGIRGRAYASEHHDPMKIARQLITVYKSLGD
ncbi:glycosyltransferase family 4 protein [Paenibacillus sp. LPE1-1-1.1]|uniref:glycosyltransferase family 4 protein n=1 Tax=Paenibacillus sp. LPE1-1-1.1 TaxID=3135230 RepID=UPI003420F7AC